MWHGARFLQGYRNAGARLIRRRDCRRIAPRELHFALHTYGKVAKVALCGGRKGALSDVVVRTDSKRRQDRQHDHGDNKFHDCECGRPPIIHSVILSEEEKDDRIALVIHKFISCDVQSGP